MSEPAVQIEPTTATLPEHCDELIGAAINAGDIDAVLALYETDATFVTERGQSVTGKDAIRTVMEGFLALKPTFDLEILDVARSGDVALLRARWHLAGTDGDGAPVAITGNSVEVVRRQPNGDWLFAIDSPYGAD